MTTQLERLKAYTERESDGLEPDLDKRVEEIGFQKDLELATFLVEYGDKMTNAILNQSLDALGTYGGVASALASSFMTGVMAGVVIERERVADEA